MLRVSEDEKADCDIRVSTATPHNSLLVLALAAPVSAVVVLAVVALSEQNMRNGAGQHNNP